MQDLIKSAQTPEKYDNSLKINVEKGENRETDSKLNLLDMSLEELELMFARMGEEKYRAKQVFQWLHKGVGEISRMTNLSRELREKLQQRSTAAHPEIYDKRVSAIDGTAKYLLKLSDGNIVESVLMQYKHGLSVCISSQVGCRMGCTFCASTGLGFIRNLTPGEMLGEVLVMQKDAGKRISNIVIMGIGEPLDNYDNVIKFLKLVNHPEGINIGYRHISLSTCGLVPRILDLAEENLPITLSVSLHAPNQKKREKLMPIAKRYSIDKILEACKIYTEKTSRRITFEYAMISDENDSADDARELGSRLKGMLCHVNLIPVNAIQNGRYVKSSRQRIESFQKILENYGIETTVRRELGSDIEAACGQLRRNTLNINKS